MSIVFRPSYARRCFSHPSVLVVSPPVVRSQLSRSDLCCAPSSSVHAQTAGTCRQHSPTIEYRRSRISFLLKATELDVRSTNTIRGLLYLSDAFAGSSPDDALLAG